jgi:hypothetical protein
MKICQIKPKVQHSHDLAQTKERRKEHVPDMIEPKAPWEHAPSLARSPPCEGGGDRSQSRGSRHLGASDPHPAPLVPFFDWQWHGSMQRRGGRDFAPKIATAPLTSLYKLPSKTYTKTARRAGELHYYISFS